MPPSTSAEKRQKEIIATLYKEEENTAHPKV